MSSVQRDSSQSRTDTSGCLDSALEKHWKWLGNGTVSTSADINFDRKILVRVLNSVLASSVQPPLYPCNPRYSARNYLEWLEFLNSFWIPWHRKWSSEHFNYLDASKVRKNCDNERYVFSCGWEGIPYDQYLHCPQDWLHKDDEEKGVFQWARLKGRHVIM